MSNELTLAADILEKAAAYIEAVEAEKAAAEAAAKIKVASDLRSKVADLTGEEISDEVVTKLAAAGPEVHALVEKLSASLRAPDSMGGPSEDVDTSSEPRTKKEASEQASARFADWLNS